MSDTMTIGRTTQMSPESTHGVAPGGGATKQLVDTILAMDPSYKSSEIRGTGRRFLSEVVPDGQEATAGKLSGGLGYNSWVYFLSMMFGAATVTTPTGAVAAKQWKWTVPLTGSINPVSMDVEQGDANDADQYLYTIMDSFGIDATRTAVAPAGTLWARATNKLTPVGTFAGMTSAGVTALALAPVLPKHWSVYFDTVYGNLGSTKLTRAFHAKLDYGGAFVPFFPLDSALPSYGGIADGDSVKATMMIEMMKSVTVDPTASEQLWLVARAAGTRYCRLYAGGSGVAPLIDNLFQLNGSSSYSAGSVGFTYKGQTATWAFNASVGTIQTAIAALSTVGSGNVSVSGAGNMNTNNTITVAMIGALAQDQTAPTITTQPTGGTVTVTPLAIPFSMQYDMALQANAPGPNKDFEGLRTREWTFDIVEDPALWGNALVITVVNGLTSGTL